MAEAKEFPPQQVRTIVSEVAALLKERKETVSVAETVRPAPWFMDRNLQALSGFFRIGFVWQICRKYHAAKPETSTTPRFSIY